MSIANLFVPNDYTINCGNLIANTVLIKDTVDDIAPITWFSSTSKVFAVTGTAGFSTTINIVRLNNIVTLTMNNESHAAAVPGTTLSTAFTDMPSYAIPVQTCFAMVPVTNLGDVTSGLVTINTNGSLVFQPLAAGTLIGSIYNTPGNCGWPANTFSYPIN